MGNKKKARYKVGDTVVITMYGTVGKVTDVKFIEGSFVYEVNYSEGLYLEPLLVSVEEYDGNLVQDKEEINIEYRFFFGDLVQVDGYEEEYFKVIGFRTEIWRYKENAWEDVVYELSRLSDGEWLEAHEDELILIADAESADAHFQDLGLMYPLKKTKPAKEMKKQEAALKAEVRTLQELQEQKLVIDQLLDLYNDYAALYQTFRDEEYKKVMLLTLLKLKNLSSHSRKPIDKNSK
ncbi:hypothetical protein [Bacillus testis]|uniref:hypothetical protein n=1 Tax=Bacillus testis TaxID=1622072 RepID=UPI00067EA0BF|nr:hypothetical protein [Bacillus testis]